MSIKTNIKLEQALTDILDIKSRLQALELAYSERPKHNDFLPLLDAAGKVAQTNMHSLTNPVSRETRSEPIAALKKRRRRTKAVDKRTKAYKESRNNIKNEAQPAESR